MWENNTSAKWYREWQNGLNPIHGLQACIYKDFACMYSQELGNFTNIWYKSKRLVNTSWLTRFSLVAR